MSPIDGVIVGTAVIGVPTDIHSFETACELDDVDMAHSFIETNTKISFNFLMMIFKYGAEKVFSLTMPKITKSYIMECSKEFICEAINNDQGLFLWNIRIHSIMKVAASWPTIYINVALKSKRNVSLHYLLRFADREEKISALRRIVCDFDVKQLEIVLNSGCKNIHHVIVRLFMYVCRTGKEDMVMLFIRKGLIKPKSNDILLYENAAKNGHTGVLNILIKNNFKYKNIFNFTPLLIAASKGHEDSVELLIRHDSEKIFKKLRVVDFKSEYGLITGDTLLGTAVRHNHHKCLEIMCKTHDFKSWGGTEALLKLSIAYKHHDCTRILRKYHIKTKDPCLLC